MPHTFTWDIPERYGPAGIRGYYYTTDGTTPTKDSAFTPMTSFTYDPADVDTTGIVIQVAAESNTGKISDPARFILKIDVQDPRVIE